jgi:hypothetical protein
MSMLFPQAAAAVLLEVTLLEYDQAAWVEGFWLATGDNMFETQLGWPKALGGLIMPNMPFWQWVGVPQ